MPTPHYSVFTGRMPFLSPNQQYVKALVANYLCYKKDAIRLAWFAANYIAQSVPQGGSMASLTNLHVSI